MAKDTEALKLQIEQRLKIPANLLTGETAEEIIDQAKRIIAFKEKTTHAESTRELFAKCVSGQLEESSRRTAEAFGLPQQTTPIKELEEIKAEALGYMPDGGESGIYEHMLSDGRPTREQFSDWLSGI